MPKISFSNNVIPINQIDVKQRKKIQKLYENAIKDVQGQIDNLKSMGKSNASTKLQIYRLNQLKDDIQYNLKEVTGEIEKEIKNNMKLVSEMTIDRYMEYMGGQGIQFKISYAHISNNIINNITSGNLYKDQFGADWNFSKRIWGDYRSAKGELASIVTNGMLQGKGCYDIAKDLEKYVMPNAQKPWDWSKVYPGCRKKIDYNAQRLARTMISHAYQQSLVEMSKNNPFASGIEWRSALIEHRTCELCMQRHGQIFPVNELPLDHPNGLCTYLMVFNKSKKEIADELVNWVNGEENPELDKYATYLTGEDFSKMSKKQKIQNMKVSKEKKKEEIKQMPEKQEKEKEKDWKQQIYEIQNINSENITEEHILRAGKIMQEQIRGMQNQLQEEFKRIDKEASAIWSKIAEARKNNSEDAFALIKEYTEFNAKGKKEKLIEQYQSNLKQKLSEIRNIGITEDIKRDINKLITGSAKETVISACDLYPTDWLIDAINKGAIKTKFVTRGYSAGGIIAISKGADSDKNHRCAIHELGHHFEYVSHLNKDEKIFYERRTKGEELVKLGEGYNSNEKTRKDDFLHPYMGKYYTGTDYELCSMGFEYVYTQPIEFAKDEDMESWILGLLAIR